MQVALFQTLHRHSPPISASVNPKSFRDITGFSVALHFIPAIHVEPNQITKSIRIKLIYGNAEPSEPRTNAGSIGD